MHAPFIDKYMERRHVEVVKSPGEFRFPNYEKVYILMEGYGDFEFEYKREMPDLKLTNYGALFSWYITILAGFSIWIIYFIVFEGRKFVNWAQNKLRGSSHKVRIGNSTVNDPDFQSEHLDQTPRHQNESFNVLL